jgi:hypothetical protein
MKNWSAFVRHARSFHVTATEQRFKVEEWSKDKSAFIANPARWQQEFDDFELLLDALIRHATG